MTLAFYQVNFMYSVAPFSNMNYCGSTKKPKNWTQVRLLKKSQIWKLVDNYVAKIINENLNITNLKYMRRGFPFIYFTKKLSTNIFWPIREYEFQVHKIEFPFIYSIIGLSTNIFTLIRVRISSTCKWDSPSFISFWAKLLITLEWKFGGIQYICNLVNVPLTKKW